MTTEIARSNLLGSLLLPDGDDPFDISAINDALLWNMKQRMISGMFDLTEMAANAGRGIVVLPKVGQLVGLVPAAGDDCTQYCTSARSSISWSAPSSFTYGMHYTPAGFVGRMAPRASGNNLAIVAGEQVGSNDIAVNYADEDGNWSGVLLPQATYGRVPMDIAWTGSQFIMGTANPSSDVGRIFTSDTGATWSLAHATSAHWKRPARFATDGAGSWLATITSFAVSSDERVAISVDGGSNWTEYATNVPWPSGSSGSWSMLACAYDTSLGLWLLGEHAGPKIWGAADPTAGSWSEIASVPSSLGGVTLASVFDIIPLGGNAWVVVAGQDDYGYAKTNGALLVTPDAGTTWEFLHDELFAAEMLLCDGRVNVSAIDETTKAFVSGRIL